LVENKLFIGDLI